MATKKMVDVRDLILDHLKLIKRPLSWLAEPNTNIPYGTIYSIFRQKAMELNEERIAEINKLLETNFKLRK